MKKFIEKHGHGFGRVTINDKLTSDLLRTLSNEQMEVIINIVIFGDVHEIGLHEDILGRFNHIPTCLPDKEMDEESETRLAIAASLLYLADKRIDESDNIVEE